MSILDDIVHATRIRVDQEKIDFPVESLASMPPRAVNNFAAAFPSDRVNIIAEVKRASPSVGNIAPNAVIADVVREYLEAGAAAVSILTEPIFFHGDRNGLIESRKRYPHASLLMKDFIVDPYQIDRAYVDGADAVLLIITSLGESPAREFLRQADRLGMTAVVEVHDEAEMEVALRIGAHVIGVNNRNLRTMTTSLNTSRRLISMAPSSITMIAESGIDHANDIRELRNLGYRGFLIGTHFMTSDSPGQTLRDLLAESS